jgi:hypothetical protein
LINTIFITQIEIKFIIVHSGLKRIDVSRSHLFVPCFVQLIRQLYVKRPMLSIVFDKKFSGF